MLRANFAQTNHKRKGVVIMTTIFALDVGNKQTKFKSKDYEGVFPSALINQRDVQSVFSLGTPEGLTSAKVNGDSQAYYCGQGVLNYSQNKLLDSLGFGDRYKPSGKSFYACAENRLVQISPWNYEYCRNLAVNREVCLVMNELARVIAGVGDGWWK